MTLMCVCACRMSLPLKAVSPLCDDLTVSMDEDNIIRFKYFFHFYRCQHDFLTLFV